MAELKVNRRSFFARTIGAVVAATVAPIIARPRWVAFASTKAWIPLTFRGAPVVYDPNVPSNTVYFFDPKGVYVSRVGSDWMKLR